VQDAGTKSAMKRGRELHFSVVCCASPFHIFPVYTKEGTFISSFHQLKKEKKTTEARERIY